MGPSPTPFFRNVSISNISRIDVGGFVITVVSSLI